MALKHLGIDFGSKRIGLALSDDTATVAFPYKTVTNTPKALDEILEIITFERVAKVVLGESKDKDMKDNPIMEQIHTFKTLLEEKGIEVVFHSEFFSSAQVLSTMGEQNKAIDASAAAIILQSYLDLQKALAEV
jgi:putative Holliday junction resolvase